MGLRNDYMSMGSFARPQGLSDANMRCALKDSSKVRDLLYLLRELKVTSQDHLAMNRDFIDYLLRVRKR